MNQYIWLFPVLFIFHDLEEIIGFGIWQKKNMPTLEKRMPKLAPMYKQIFQDYSTEGMALAVFEIFTLCILVCECSRLVGRYHLWIGLFIAFVIHLFMHLFQAVVWRGYIPAIITSALVMAPSIYVVHKSLCILGYSMKTVVLWSMIGLVAIILNVKVAHGLMHHFTRKYVGEAHK